MNKIEAIIRPDKLSSVTAALADVGLVGLNTTQVTGRGVQRGVTMSGSHTASYVVDMLPKVKLEIVVSDADTSKAIDIIIDSARTGNIGDGKIFVSPVTTAFRVRTGEEGDKAL